MNLCQHRDTKSYISDLLTRPFHAYFDTLFETTRLTFRAVRPFHRTVSTLFANVALNALHLMLNIPSEESLRS